MGTKKFRTLGLLILLLAVPVAARSLYKVNTDDVKEASGNDLKRMFHGFFPPGQGCSGTLVKLTTGKYAYLTAAHCGENAEIAFDHKEGNRFPATCKHHPKWTPIAPCTGDKEKSPSDLTVCFFEGEPPVPSDAKPACLSPKAPAVGDKLVVFGAGGQPGVKPPKFKTGTLTVEKLAGFEIITTRGVESGDSGGSVFKDDQLVGVTSGGGDDKSCFTDVNEAENLEFLKEQKVAFCDGPGGAPGPVGSDAPEPSNLPSDAPTALFQRSPSWDERSDKDDAVPHSRGRSVEGVTHEQNR